MNPALSTLSVCKELIQEHRSAELVLDELDFALDASSEAFHTCLKTRWPLLKAELAIHFACEEQGIFLAIEPKHSMVLMEAEHDQILSLQGQLDMLLECDSWQPRQREEAKRLTKRLITELRDHISREEYGIFPLCESKLNDEEKQWALDRMTAIRTQARQGIEPNLRRPEACCKSFQFPEPFEKDLPISVTTLAESQAEQVKLLEMKAGAEMAKHWSPKAIVVTCLQGAVEFETDVCPDPQRLTAGQGQTLSPQLRHRVKALEDSRLLLVFHNRRRSAL